MLMVEQYPMVLRSDGPRGRPRHVKRLPSGSWRVDWIDGFLSVYRADPRGHLRRIVIDDYFAAREPQRLDQLPAPLGSRGSLRSSSWISSLNGSSFDAAAGH